MLILMQVVLCMDNPKICSSVQSLSTIPSYNIEYSKNFYHVEVSKAPCGDAKVAKRQMILEVKKNSLMGMAYINELAKEGFEFAKHIALLYQGFRAFFSSRDTQVFLKVCDSVLEGADIDRLAKQAAQYLKDLLLCRRTKDSDGKTFVKELIPSIEEMLSYTPPKKNSVTQVVHIEEMKSSHNAFPDIVKYGKDYYLCFREAKSHVGYKDLGFVRILKGHFDSQTKKWSWVNEATIKSTKYDLRDPKFFVGKDGKLFMIVDGSVIDKKNETIDMVPHVAIKENGSWQLQRANVDPSGKGDKGQWLWRVTWNEALKAGYGFSYGKGSSLSLMKTVDGVRYEKITEISTDKLPDDSLNEATVRFKSDGTAVAFIRTSRNALIGVSSPSSGYRGWAFEVIPFRVGGPDFVISEKDATMWAATRHFFITDDNILDEVCVVGLMNTEQFVPLLRLKSCGDSSYPSMLLEDDGMLTVAYYSSHKDISQIYITSLRLQPAQNLSL